MRASPETKLKILQSSSADKIAASFDAPLQVHWDRKVSSDLPQHPTEYKTEQERYDAVLEHVRETLGILLPDDEAKCREIFALIPWPVASDTTPVYFAPDLTFEAVFESGAARPETRDEELSRVVEAWTDNRKILQSMSAAKIAASLRAPLQVHWDQEAWFRDEPRVTADAAQQILDEEDKRILQVTHRYAAILAVLGHVRRVLGLFLPDDEAKAREVFALIPWPPGFAPNPTFEEVFDVTHQAYAPTTELRLRRTSEDQQEKFSLLRGLEVDQIVGKFKSPLQTRWEGGSGCGMGPRYETEQERYEAVLECVEDLRLLLPDHEAKAREIFALIPWPKRGSCLATEDFAPIPTFEAVFGGTCKTCGGDGVAGFLFGIACPHCSGPSEGFDISTIRPKGTPR